MGIKTLQLGIVAEPTISGGNVTVTVTGGDQTQTFSIPKSGDLTIPTSLMGARYVEIPVTADDYLFKSNFTFVPAQFFTKNIGISVAGGNIAVASWKTNYRRNYTTDPLTSTGSNYDYSIIVEDPKYNNLIDETRMKVESSLVGNVVTFTEGVGTAVINDGETFTAKIDIDYYVPVQ
jgi:hypothetical protein